jgi:hypothetical protein
MKVVCAWCRKEIAGKAADPGAHPITHGICVDCLTNIYRERGKTLQALLNEFSAPVLVVGSDARIVCGNKAALSALDKDLAAVAGQRGGDAFECRYARLPGGCGETVHCKSCAIRNTVMDTLHTGQSHLRVPAYADLCHITGERRIRFLISTEKAGNGVLLRIDETNDEGPAPPLAGGACHIGDR